MGRKDERTIPWSSVYVVAMGLFATGMSTSYMFPLAGFLVLDSKIVSESGNLGYFYGLMASSFICGKLMSYYIWAAIANLCGRRLIFSFCLVLESVIILAFGLTNEFYTLLVLRFCAGFFSLNIFVAKAVLRELSMVCEEDYPQVAQYSSTLYTFSLIAGAGAGGYLSYPDRHNIVDSDSIFVEHPFMLPSLVVSFTNLLAFCVSTAMLPETLQIRTEVQKKPQQKPPPEFKNDLTQHKTKYIELAETKTEQAAPTQPHQYLESEGPVTERQENEQDEEIPSYLQMSDFALVNGEEEEISPTQNPVNINSHEFRFLSPKASQKQIELESRRPQSARPKLLSSFRSPMNSSRNHSRKKNSLNEFQLTPITSTPRSHERQTSGSNLQVKCTHISYIEEDFERIQHDSTSPEVTLENKYRRYHVPNILKDPATANSLILKAVHSFIVGYHDELIIFWMMTKHGFDLSVFQVSIVLMIVYTVSMTTSYYKIDEYLIRTPLHKQLLSLLIVSVVFNFGFPNILYIDSSSKLVVVVLIVAYIPLFAVNNMTANFIMLLVSDSTNSNQRELMEKTSDGLSLLFRGLGTLLGPVILHELSMSKLDYRIAFILPGVLLVCLSVLSWRVRKYFPRFYNAPYIV